MRHLDAMGVPYHVIVETDEVDAYSKVVCRERLLVLDPEYQRNYDACMVLGVGQSVGSGPARNFAWDHAVASGSKWHWVIDDNIKGFFRLHQNLKVPVSDGTILRCMEDFALRYKNVAMAGPNYFKFASQKSRMPPFVANTRLYSCILIRNDIPFRWRARYNEDVDLSLRVLKSGWATIQFNAFLQDKANTQTVRGGNLSAFYAAEGTLPKSQMIARLHPDVAKVVWRFGRWHHSVDYRPFKRTKLIRRSDITIPEGVNDYGMRLVNLEQGEKNASGTSAD